MSEEKIYIKNKYNLKLSCIINKFDDSNSIVVISHARGSNKNSRATKAISESLNKEKFNNIRYDLTACGESEGNELDILVSKSASDLESVLDYLKEKGFKEFILVGYSLGGRISTMIDFKKYNIKKLVLWAPALLYKNKLKLLKNKLFKTKKEKEAIKQGYSVLNISKRSAKYFEEERKTDYFANAVKINKPILIIHGDEDPFVNYKNSIKFKEKNKLTKLIIIKGENHGFKKDDKNLYYACDKTIEFIKNNS